MKTLLNKQLKGRITRWGFLAVALLALLPVSLLAAPKKAEPIVVSINDVPNAAPVIQVQGAPNGYDIYLINDPGKEDGALITLIGVNNYFDPGALPEWGGRFVVPEAPLWYRTAVDIVWVSHDADVFGLGDLQVGFNSALPGTYYLNPGLCCRPDGSPFNEDVDLGLVTDNWVTVYANDTLVVRYKPHTYRLTVERPFKASGIVTEIIPNEDGSGTMEVVGTATHLGKFVSRADWTLNSDGTLHVWAEFRAANGDTLKAEFKEWVSPWGDATITGGTGRFANASGSYGAGFSGDNQEIFTAEGTISY